LEKDDVLPKAIPYTGNTLKIEGYYYQIAYNGIIYNPHIIYRNGVLITLGGSENSVEEMDKYIRKRMESSRYQKIKYLWGVFFIDENIIRIYSLSQDYPHKGYSQEGIILNDTTFQITKFSSDGKIKEYNDIYHFREFSPKPDSTNVYIK
jgi:hypothetical protein